MCNFKLEMRNFVWQICIQIGIFLIGRVSECFIMLFWSFSIVCTSVACIGFGRICISNCPCVCICVGSACICLSWSWLIFWREKEPTRRSLSFDGLCIANSICSCFPSVLMLFVYKTCRMSCAFFVFVVWQPSARIINSTILSFFLSHAYTSFAIFKMLFFFPNSPLVVSVWRAVVYIHICACMTRD